MMLRVSSLTLRALGRVTVKEYLCSYGLIKLTALLPRSFPVGVLNMPEAHMIMPELPLNRSEEALNSPEGPLNLPEAYMNIAD
jgi:hypothetical protein